MMVPDTLSWEAVQKFLCKQRYKLLVAAEKVRIKTVSAVIKSALLKDELEL